MNQGKTGAFIAGCRREKGWTQSQLAQRLGITDKAVSKWETGRSMPDLSLFAPLCSLLGITINELLAGEHIPEDRIREKTDEVLMEVIGHWLGKDTKEAGNEAASAENVLNVQHVTKLYESRDSRTVAVDDVSFQVARGSFTGIMGASGCGKTTLLQLIATIDAPTKGKIELNGQELTALPEEGAAEFRREHLGFIFQDYNLLDTLTIYENIALALMVKGFSEERIRCDIAGLSKKLNIASVLDKFPYEVSGGQRQRCACARAVAVNPDIILADEPTGALDSYAARQLLDTFAMLRDECRATILMVTHDVLSASYCDRILFMQDGRIRAELEKGQRSRQDFFAEILKRMAWMAEGGSYVF